MAKPKPLPPIERLRQLLEYDPETGALTFLPREEGPDYWNKRFAGKPALNTLSAFGYLVGFVDGKQHLSHRVAYAMHTGRSDLEFIDHINGDRQDNRIKNLREVDYLANARNKALSRNSSTGVTGVSCRGDRFRACITVNSRCIVLGVFNTLGEARAARKAAEKIVGFHANHGQVREVERADTTAGYKSGCANANSKMTPAKVARMQELRDAGTPIRKVAEMAGSSVSAAYRLTERRIRNA